MILHLLQYLAHTNCSAEPTSKMKILFALHAGKTFLSLIILERSPSLRKIIYCVIRYYYTHIIDYHKKNYNC